MLTSRIIDTENKSKSLSKRPNLRPNVQFGEVLQQNSMVQDFKHPKWYITPPRERGGGDKQENQA